MQFPLQVTQAITIRDGNGNLVISIGPGPDMWVYGQNNAMHLTPSSTIPFPFGTSTATIEFYKSVNYTPTLVYQPASISGTQYSGQGAQSVLLTMQSGVFNPGTYKDYSNIILTDEGYTLFATFTSVSAPNLKIDADGTFGIQHKGIVVSPYFSVDDDGLGGTWRNLVLQNGWANVGGGFANCQYKMMADGYVGFRGNMSGGVKVDGTVLFNVPVAYRSKYPKQCVVRTESNNPTFLNIRVDNGNVEVYNMPTGNVICLDDLRFPALVDFV